MTYSPFRHIGSVFWKYNPLHLTFFLTRRCNQKCSFCFYLKDADNSKIPPYPPLTKGEGGDLVSASPKGEELSLDEIQQISSSLGNLLWLAFSGGEIFLRNDLVEITREFYEKNKPAIILFPTNGLLTDIIKKKIEAILDYCQKSIVVVKLSLDGTEYVHDSIRGKGSFQKTMQTYNELGGLLGRYPNFELGINTVFCASNQNNMDSLLEFINKLDNVKTHTVSLIRGEVLDEGLKDIDINTYHETLKKMESNLKNRTSSIYRFRGARLKAAQDILQRRLIYETIRQNRQLIPCYAGRLNLVLTETGDVYPCESFSACMKIGNIKDNEYNLKRVLKTDRAQKVIHSIQNNSCYCTHECYFMTNILFNPKLYLLLAKEYLPLR